MKQFLPTALLAMLTYEVPAQLVVTDQLNADELVQEIFQGTGVAISNVTLNGAPGSTMSTSMGYYTYEGVLPIPSAGIVLSTGSVTSVWGGSGYSIDPDLTQLAGAPIYDVMALEFDFVPEEDTMIFDFVFGSSEYLSFTCSPFNDAFGFFLSGPGISGPYQNNAVNIALVPNTQIPISINTVNSGTPSAAGNASICELSDPNWQDNSIYFVPDTSSSALFFNGMTVTLEARYVLTPGQTYHIKLAVCDASDGALDSGVFLKAASFRAVGSLITALREQERQRLNAWFDATGDLVIDAGDENLSRVRLFDAQGRLVVDRRSGSSGISALSLGELTTGVYHVEAAVGDSIQRTRLVRTVVR